MARQHNIYFSPNEPRPDAPPGKLKKADIVKLRAVFVDVDPQGGGDKLDAERARIKGLMVDLNDEPMPPCHVIDSGGGCQAFWTIEKVEANAANLKIAEDIGDCLSKRLSGDAVQNIDRIMRLPGTDNIPDAKKRRKGRVQRRAIVLYSSPATYTLEQLVEEFPAPPEKLKRRPSEHPRMG